MTRKVVREEKDRGGNTVRHYNDGTEEKDTQTFSGKTETHVYKSGGAFDIGPGEELGTVRSTVHPSGIIEKNITYSDGTSAHGYHYPNAFLGSNNSMSRDGKMTKETPTESMINHQKELAANLKNTPPKKTANEYTNNSDYGYGQKSNSVGHTTGSISRNQKTRKQEVEEIEDQALLREIVDHDLDPEIKNIAMRKLKDQDELYLLAQTGWDSDRREDAIRKLQEDKLFLLAEFGGRQETRKLAMDGLEGCQSGHQHRANQSKNINLREMAIRDLEVWYTKIRQLAKTAKDPEIRKRATIYLKNQNTLRYLARNDSNPGVRRLATISLQDKTTLKYLSENDADEEVRNIASTNLVNQNVLKDIGTQESDLAVKSVVIRKAIISKMTNQDELYFLANHDPDKEIRELATTKIKNQNKLKKLAILGKNGKVKETAVKKITQKDTLKEIAQNAKDGEISELALNKIKDQEILKDIVKNTENQKIRELALDRITDQKILKELSESPESPFIRRRATKKITDQEILKDLAMHSMYQETSVIATEKITDEKTLKEIKRHRRIREIKRILVSIFK